MNITNSTQIYYESNLEYELKFLLCLFGVIIFIIIPCFAETDEYKNINTICKPLYCWITSLIYILVTIYNCIFYIYNNILYILNNRGYIINNTIDVVSKICEIKKYCQCFIEIPEAITVNNISENIPDTVIIIFNDSIIVNAPLDQTHACVINNMPVGIIEEIHSNIDNSPSCISSSSISS